MHHAICCRYRQHIVYAARQVNSRFVRSWLHYDLREAPFGREHGDECAQIREVAGCIFGFLLLSVAANVTGRKYVDCVLVARACQVLGSQGRFKGQVLNCDVVFATTYLMQLRAILKIEKPQNSSFVRSGSHHATILTQCQLCNIAIMRIDGQ